MPKNDKKWTDSKKRNNLGHFIFSETNEAHCMLFSIL